MSKTYLRMFVTVFKKKSHSKTSYYYDWCWLWLYFGWKWVWWKIEVENNVSVNSARNSTDDNNRNAILYVFFHCRIIKYQYVNIIWIFIFFLCLVSSFTVSCLSFLKISWCPNVFNSIKYGSKRWNFLFANGRRAYYIQLFLCQKSYF